MRATHLPAILPDGFAPLTKALGDLGVERLARTLNLDLQDPKTLNKLLSLTQRYVDTSPQISPIQRQMLSQALVRDQSRFVRDAIRTYLTIAAMTY